MSCWRRTTVLRIPASTLGFTFRREWNAFLNEHDDDFNWEPGYFAESLSDSYPAGFRWREAGFTDPEWRLDQRNPKHPEIVPGPFLDYCLDEEEPVEPEPENRTLNDIARPLSDAEMKEYLPLFRSLFPHFAPENMRAVYLCRYDWYDGTNAPYLYSDLD